VAISRINGLPDAFFLPAPLLFKHEIYNKAFQIDI